MDRSQPAGSGGGPGRGCPVSYRYASCAPLKISLAKEILHIVRFGVRLFHPRIIRAVTHQQIFVRTAENGL